MHWLLIVSHRLAGSLPAVFSLAGALALTAAGLAWHAGVPGGAGGCLALAGLAFFLVGRCERDQRRWDAIVDAIGPAPRIRLRRYAQAGFSLAAGLWLGLAVLALTRADMAVALGSGLLAVVSQRLGLWAGRTS